MTTTARRILWIDGASGLAAGAGVLALHAWLAALQGLPVRLVLFIGAVNVAYGAYSGSLAVRASRGVAPPRWAVDLLAGGNAAWGGVCVALVATHRDTISAFGVALLLFEAAYVGALAALEWRVVRRAVRPTVRGDASGAANR